MANRTWHYDTRYFTTSVASMKRVVVRVWAGDSKAKGNPIAEATGFVGTTLSTPGSSNTDWTVGTVATTPANGQPGNVATPPATTNPAIPGTGIGTQPGILPNTP
jgi:hypothetical protein